MNVSVSSGRIEDPKELSFLWLELTNKCNLECRHCYADSSPFSVDAAPLSFDQYCRILHDAGAHGCRQVQFIGGEPTLNTHLPALIEQSAAMGFERIEVFTNLLALPKALLEQFVAHDVCVATSIYSVDPTVHDAITGRVGSWKRTTRNLQAVLDRDLDVRASIIVMDQNRGDVERTVKWLAGIGVLNVGVDDQRDFGRANRAETCDMGDLCGQCAQGTLCVSPEGAASPCIMSKAWAVGSTNDAGLTPILESARLAEVRRQIREQTAARRHGSGDTNCVPYYCSPSYWCSPGKGQVEPAGLA